MMTENKSRLIAIITAFVPLISLIIAGALMSGGGGGEAPATNSAATAEPTNASPPITIMLIVLILLGAKLTAIVSNFRLKYFGWIYHVLELYLVVFLLGLFVVLSTFNQSWDAAGAIKLVVTFLLAVGNLKLKDLWLGSDIRHDFHVARITHADL